MKPMWQVQEELKDAFRIFDKDGNGQIDKTGASYFPCTILYEFVKLSILCTLCAPYHEMLNCIVYRHCIYMLYAINF
jgi:hypothetical protein